MEAIRNRCSYKILKPAGQKIKMMFDPMKEKISEDKETRGKLHDYVAQVRPILTYITALRTNIIRSRYTRYLSERDRPSRSYGTHLEDLPDL